jgi:hypothetical protein
VSRVCFWKSALKQAAGCPSNPGPGPKVLSPRENSLPLQKRYSQHAEGLTRVPEAPRDSVVSRKPVRPGPPDASPPGYPGGERRARDQTGANDRSRPRCQPVLASPTPSRLPDTRLLLDLASASLAPACLCSRGRTTQCRKAKRRLPLDKRFQSQMNQTGFLLDACTNLRFGHQFIIQIDGRSHAYKYACFICISQPRQKRLGVSDGAVE